MTDKQLTVMTIFFADWIEKASVGCLIVGLFQRDHMFGGIIGSIICLLFALCLKIRSAK